MYFVGDVVQFLQAVAFAKLMLKVKGAQKRKEEGGLSKRQVFYATFCATTSAIGRAFFK